MIFIRFGVFIYIYIWTVRDGFHVIFSWMALDCFGMVLPATKARRYAVDDLDGMG